MATIAESRTKLMDVAVHACNEYRGRKITMVELARHLGALTATERAVVADITRMRIATLEEIARLGGGSAA